MFMFFSKIKKDMRVREARLRLRSTDGALQAMDRMRIATDSIRQHVINKEWSEAFNKLGAGHANRPGSSGLQEYLGSLDIPRKLPSLLEFSKLISRPPGTPLTKRLHSMIVTWTMDIQRSPFNCRPPRAAQVDLPVSRSARPDVTRAHMAVEAPHFIVNKHLKEASGALPERFQVNTPARNMLLPARGGSTE